MPALSRLSGAVTLFVIVFMVAPILVVIGSAFSPSGYMSFPPTGFSTRWFSAFLSDPDWLFVLAVTVILSLLAALASVALGFAAALVAERRLLRSRPALDFIILLPLVFPHAALAVAILTVISAFGLLGTFGGILIAHVIITLPYAYRPIAASLAKLDLAMEEASLSLGAGPWMTFRRVTLPLVRPGLMTAFLFCFIISFDETTITLFLVGPGFTTLPIRIFSQLQDNASPLIAAISTLLIVFTTVIVVAIKAIFGLELFVDSERAG